MTGTGSNFVFNFYILYIFFVIELLGMIKSLVVVDGVVAIF